MTSPTSAEQIRRATVRNKLGIHARPAAEFVTLAKQFDAEVLVSKEGVEVNGKSIMGVLMLAAEFGSELTIRATGPDAHGAVSRLVELIEGNATEEEQ